MSSYECQYCKKIFLSEHNLTKHTRNPSKKCLQIIKKFISSNSSTSILSEDNSYKLESKILDYQKMIEEYKVLLYEYQKDYFDCLHRYIILFQENNELKKQLEKNNNNKEIDISFEKIIP
jgi:hypothetical protein